MTFNRGESRDPVENIRWAAGASGGYSCYVNLYRTHRCPIETPFRAEVQIGNQIFIYDGMTQYQNPGNNFDRMIKVIEFAYGPHGATVSSGGKAVPATVNATAWGVTPRQFVDVLGVVKSPNTWHAAADEQHAFLILAGCADNNPGIGRGFFPEMLHGDLRPVRSVLEAYNASAEIQKVNAPAAGYGISTNGAGDVVLAVTSSGVRALYKIDRWD